MGVWLGPRGAGDNGQEPLFTITKNGSPAVLNTDYYYAHQTVNGAEQWELALLTDCVINFSRVGKVDFFLVGGGQAGRIGTATSVGGVPDAYGGKGGYGAKIYENVSGTKLQTGIDYVVDIGDGGYWDYPDDIAATPTQFGSLFSSENGTSGESDNRGGGEGARAYGNQTTTAADDGDDGKYAFGSSTSLIQSLSGRKYGAGGGGAAAKNTQGVSASSNVGGTTGGGGGGAEGNIHGGAGADNTGSGGGGGYTDQTDPTTGNNGGSGILILRDHRG
jgi:hypothetical protein